jgi:hypothetical protein
LHDERRIRIRILEAQKHVDSDPQHWKKIIPDPGVKKNTGSRSKKTPDPGVKKTPDPDRNTA